MTPPIPDDPHPSQGEALAQAHARARQLADDFAAVFGQPGKRSERQERIVAHLAASCADGSNAFQFGGSHDGITQIAAGIHRDGAHSILRIIERQCSIAQRNKTEPEKPGVRVKR